ncbi:hypothetical protein DXG01_006751 [Tephrocybe rancida]|nr:hypothetical protein DXG01_006751 [Tephrocybe rancida]
MSNVRSNNRRPIRDFDRVGYPAGIQSPDPNFTRNKPGCLIRYTRNFLLQFKDYCKYKPDGLTDLDAIGLTLNTFHGQKNRPSGRSGRHRNISGVISPSRQTSLGLGTGFGKSSGPSSLSVTNFSNSGSKVSKDTERFAAASCAVFVSSNRWARKVITLDDDPALIVDRKVKALLNKLTMQNFDSISNQIVAWANKSDDEMTMSQMTRLVFENAMADIRWSGIYAHMCRKMMERIIPTTHDEGIRSTDGKPITGGQLFRKYLMNWCKEESEHGWLTEQAAAADGQVIKEAAQKSGSTEITLCSDEYFAMRKAKRRGLALISFIGELFKLQMLTERIMHERLKKLLGNVDTPEEEDLEGLCVLMKTLGFMLDTRRAAKHMDVYFARITKLKNRPLVNSRIRFLLQDVIDLRERKWVPRNSNADHATITQIHENARLIKAGDLSNFGNITKDTAVTFGPSSASAGKKGGKNKREPAPRTSSSSNMLSMLGQGTGPTAEEPKESKPQGKLLVLAPRNKPSAGDMPAELKFEVEPEAKPPVEMTEEQAIRRTAEDKKEFFTIRNFDEAEFHFTVLPPVHHFRLVEKLTSCAIEAKESHVQFLAGFFASVVEKQLCSPAAFEQGFMSIAKIIDDVTIDAPKAFTFFAIVVKSSGLDEARKARLAAMSIDATKFLELIS